MWGRRGRTSQAEDARLLRPEDRIEDRTLSAHTARIARSRAAAVKGTAPEPTHCQQRQVSARNLGYLCGERCCVSEIA